QISVLLDVRPTCSLAVPRLHRGPHSFPTRRSSDLVPAPGGNRCACTSTVRTGWSCRSGRLPCPRWCGICSRVPGSVTRCRRKRRSEEHTSELQSRENLVCRLPLEKKNIFSTTLRPE